MFIMTIKEDFKKVIDEREHYKMQYEKVLTAYIKLRKDYLKLMERIK